MVKSPKKKNLTLSTARIIQRLGIFFPGAFGKKSDFLHNPDGQRILERIKTIPTEPLHLTNFNQLLHLVHEAGVSEGFFKYYFLSVPDQHPYPLNKMQMAAPELNESGISSIEQAEWGFLRLFTDALLFWGDIRSAVRVLRVMTYEQLEEFFESKRFPSDEMRSRGPILPMEKILMDDRYLISEIAFKAYTSEGTKNINTDQLHIEEVLLEAYRSAGGGRMIVKTLFDKDSKLAKSAPDQQFMLQLAAEEFMDEEIENEDDIKGKVATIAKRFIKARDAAHENTRLYLSELLPGNRTVETSEFP